MRIIQLLIAITIIAKANITFAFFMIHGSYCKINEFRASFVLLQELLLTDYRQKPPDEFRLQRDFKEFWPIVHEHIRCIKKAETKLPQWLAAGCIFATTPLEQATSAEVAAFHTSFAQDQNILSITGGLGVDDAAFARKNSKVTSLDPDVCLNALARYNWEQLGIVNIDRRDSSAEDFLARNHHQFDLVYADPDRRPQGNRTGGKISDFSPDIFALQQKHAKIAAQWLTKLSPLTDVQWLLQHAPSPADIYIVEQNKEVKEVLCHQHPKANGKVALVVLNEDKTFIWNGQDPIFTAGSQTHFYEANAGTIKAGFHRNIANLASVEVQNGNHTYFMGKAELPGDLARKFNLLSTGKGSLTTLKQQLSALEIHSANISSRDFVIKTEELREKLGLKDGGNTYIFLTGKKEKTWFICQKA